MAIYPSIQPKYSMYPSGYGSSGVPLNPMAYNIPSYGGGGGDMFSSLVSAAPMTGMGPAGWIGAGSSVLSTGLSALSGLLEDKGKTTAQMHSQMKAAQPPRAMINMSPEQYAMFRYFMEQNKKRVEDYNRGQTPMQQYMSRVNLTGTAISDLKKRADAIRMAKSGLPMV